MSRLQVVDPAAATGKAKELLDGVQAKLHFVPNMTKVMANSPAVLESYLGFSGALAHGQLPAKLREQIALMVAQQNQCDYCLSAHTTVGKLVGLQQEQTIAARQGDGGSEKATAALTFARAVLEKKGQINDQDVAAVRAVGYTDGEIAEIIAHVAENIFTNYFNTATQAVVDFPKVSYTEIA